MKIDLQEIGFKVISSAGEARSIILETLDDLKDNKINIKEAQDKLNMASKLINESARSHMEVVTKEAQGIKLEFSAFFMHAEDIFLTTQTMLELAKRLIHLY